MNEAFSNENISRQFNNDPREILKAFADEMGEDMGPPIEEVIAPDEPILETPVVEEAKDDIQSLMDRLMAVKDNEETEKADKTTAEELAARLEELKTAKKNAEDFLAEKEKVVVDAEVETPEGGAEVVAEIAPPLV